MGSGSPATEMGDIAGAYRHKQDGCGALAETQARRDNESTRLKRAFSSDSRVTLTVLTIWQHVGHKTLPLGSARSASTAASNSYLASTQRGPALKNQVDPKRFKARARFGGQRVDVLARARAKHLQSI